MKEATRIQIENMKNQTFGAEIEGNNITRKKAAEKAAAYFGTGRSEYTAGRNGYMTWSAWDAQGREWKFQRDVSISGPDDQKCEMVTPILTYADMELLQGLVRVLRKAGMKSDAGRGCGVHIHIGAKGHTPQTIRNLVNIMAAHESQIAKAIKISRKCLGIVYQNIAFAIGVKLICLALGAVGIASMWLAIFADVGVMILAVLNAIRALFVKNL